MKFIGQIVRTAVNAASLPFAVAADVVTLGGVINDRDQTYVGEALERLKDEADEDGGPDDDWDD